MKQYNFVRGTGATRTMRGVDKVVLFDWLQEGFISLKEAKLFCLMDEFNVEKVVFSSLTVWSE